MKKLFFAIAIVLAAASNVELPYKAKGQEGADKIRFDTTVGSISLVSINNTTKKLTVVKTLEFRESGMVFNVNAEDLLMGEQEVKIQFMLSTAPTYYEINSYPANFCYDNVTNGSYTYKGNAIDGIIALHGAPIYTMNPEVRPADTYCKLKLIVNK